jgi:hypothetical protein
MLLLDLTFAQQIQLALLENGLMALIVAGAGYALNRLLERQKTREQLQSEVYRQNRTQRLQFLGAQLQQFYLPIYFRLEKDNTLWQRLSRLAATPANPLPAPLEEVLEQQYLLRNHDEIVAIIEQHTHLAGPDAALRRALVQYVRHVAIYKLIRAVPEIRHLNPVALGEPYPKDLFALIEQNYQAVQREYDALVSG